MVGTKNPSEGQNKSSPRNPPPLKQGMDTVVATSTAEGDSHMPHDAPQSYEPSESPSGSSLPSTFPSEMPSCVLYMKSGKKGIGKKSAGKKGIEKDVDKEACEDGEEDYENGETIASSSKLAASGAVTMATSIAGVVLIGVTSAHIWV